MITLISAFCSSITSPTATHSFLNCHPLFAFLFFLLLNTDQRKFVRLPFPHSCVICCLLPFGPFVQVCPLSRGALGASYLWLCIIEACLGAGNGAPWLCAPSSIVPSPLPLRLCNTGQTDYLSIFTVGCQSEIKLSFSFSLSPLTFWSSLAAFFFFFFTASSVGKSHSNHHCYYGNSFCLFVQSVSATCYWYSILLLSAI